MAGTTGGSGVSSVEKPASFNMALFEMEQIATLKGYTDNFWPNLVEGTYTNFAYYFGLLQTLFDRISAWCENSTKERVQKNYQILAGDKTTRGLINDTGLLLQRLKAIENMEGKPFQLAREKTKERLVFNFREIKRTMYQMMLDVGLTVYIKQTYQTNTSKEFLGMVGGANK